MTREVTGGGLGVSEVVRVEEWNELASPGPNMQEATIEDRGPWKPLQWSFGIRRLEREVRLVSDDHGFYGYVPQLPGVVTQGNSLEETLSRIVEALEGAVSLYVQEGEGIPWIPATYEEGDDDGVSRWVVVDVEAPDGR
jgi:predicted RNase H-like HicB family nuclease